MEDTNFLVYECGEVGAARVTEEVVAKIAGLAACEADGVECLGGNVYKDNISRISKKALGSCVKIIRKEEGIDVLLSLTVKMGYSIPDTSKEVQEKVKSAVETMVAIPVKAVNIQISGMKVEK